MSPVPETCPAATGPAAATRTQSAQGVTELTFPLENPLFVGTCPAAATRTKVSQDRRK